MELARFKVACLTSLIVMGGVAAGMLSVSPAFGFEGGDAGGYGDSGSSGSGSGNGNGNGSSGGGGMGGEASGGGLGDGSGGGMGGDGSGGGDHDAGSYNNAFSSGWNTFSKSSVDNTASYNVGYQEGYKKGVADCSQATATVSSVEQTESQLTSADATKFSSNRIGQVRQEFMKGLEDAFAGRPIASSTVTAAYLSGYRTGLGLK